MSENELFEHRIKTLENDVKILYGKVNTFAINQAEENTKLDNLLLSVGELKESISEIKRRPSAYRLCELRRKYEFDVIYSRTRAGFNPGIKRFGTDF